MQRPDTPHKLASSPGGAVTGFDFREISHFSAGIIPRAVGCFPVRIRYVPLGMALHPFAAEKQNMSVTLSREDVEKVALLARLRLDDAELDRMTDQLGAILGYVERLSEVDTEDVEPMAHAVERMNVLREDVETESLPREAALANAPKTDGQYFLVPRIIDAG